jgi:hypothetical protein
MAGYLIYIPKITGSSPNHLVDVGLGSLLDKQNLPGVPGVGLEGADVLGHGPDKGRGVVFRWFDAKHPERAPELGMFPERQEWTPAKPTDGLEAGRFWIGIEKDRPPTPEDLQRPEMYGGLPVKLAGHDWIVPVARALPHEYGLDESGRPCRKVAREYQAFYDRAVKNFERYQEFLSGADAIIEGGFHFAVEALGMNYRVDQNIADVLRLFRSDEDLLWTVGATFELSQFMAIDAQKKTAS